MNRSCPNCKKQLFSDASFFCPFCGVSLQSDNVVHPESFVAKTTHLAYDDSHEITINLHKIKTVGLIVFVLASVVFLFIGVDFALGVIQARVINQKITVPEKKGDKQAVFNSIDLELSITETPFVTNDIPTYVPVNASFYLESTDLAYWVGTFLAEEPADHFLFKVAKIAPSKFGVYGIKVDNRWVLALIAFPTDLNAARQLIQDITVEHWTLVLVERALVITNDASQITQIEMAAKQTAKNISHSQKFSSFKSLLPKTGQLLYMNFLEFAPHEVYDLLTEFSASSEMFDMINVIKQLGYEKFVITKSNGSN